MELRRMAADAWERVSENHEKEYCKAVDVPDVFYPDHSGTAGGMHSRNCRNT